MTAECLCYHTERSVLLTLKENVQMLDIFSGLVVSGNTKIIN